MCNNISMKVWVYLLPIYTLGKYTIIVIRLFIYFFHNYLKYNRRVTIHTTVCNQVFFLSIKKIIISVCLKCNYRIKYISKLSNNNIKMLCFKLVLFSPDTLFTCWRGSDPG